MSFSTKKKNEDVIPVAFEESKRMKKTIYYDDDDDNDIYIEKEMITDEVLMEVYRHDDINSAKKREIKRDELYKRILEEKDKDLVDYLTIDKGKSKFFPLPYIFETGRDCIYISGKAGSGKSYFTKKMLYNWKKYLKLKNTIVIAPPKNKETYGKLGDINKFVSYGIDGGGNKLNDYDEMMRNYKENKIRFKHKKKLLKDDPDTLMELEIALEKSKPPPRSEMNKNKLRGLRLTDEFKKIKNTCIVFDDYESLSETDQKKCVFLINYILEAGRKDGLSIIVIRHQANAGKETSRIISECNSFVIFKKTLPKNNRYLLQKYLELNKEQINRIMKLFNKKNPYCTRWIWINTDSNILVSEKKIMQI